MLSARPTRSLSVALTVATLGLVAIAPTASAMPEDLRNTGETSSLSGTPPQDLRSPDARDAAVQSAPQDLRSPDTRDVAQNYAPAAPVSSSVSTSPDGFDWASAGIGIAVVGGALLLLVAAMGSRRVMARRHVAGT